MTVTGRLCFALVTAAALLAGCTTSTMRVSPAGETRAVGTANADAADDPAIFSYSYPGSTFRIAGRSKTSFILGTDKKAGLYVYALDGSQLQFLPDGLLNNVDLRTVGVDHRQVVIGASDRGRMGVALYLFDPASTDPDNRVQPWMFIRSDLGEPYGFCMGMFNGAAHAVLIGKDGQVREYRIHGPDRDPQWTEVRRFAVGSQAEGCVVDEAGGHLYIGEETVGVWRYAWDARSTERMLVQGIDARRRLVADVEGMTIIRDGEARYLIVSSQGDSAFAVWRVDERDPTYVGRFRVRGANGVDAVSGTDGIDAYSGPVGRFPEGLVVVQDDRNDGAQNFKLIDWREIRRVLGITR